MKNNILYVARPGFVVRDIVGEHALIPVETGNIVIAEEAYTVPEFSGMVTLNDLSLFLWNTLLEPQSFDSLLEAVKNEFEIGKDDDPKKDIADFLEIGITNQLILLIDDSQDIES